MSEQITKKPFYKKWWIWLIAIVVIVAIGKMGSEKKQSTVISANEQTKTEKTATLQSEKVPSSEKIVAKAVLTIPQKQKKFIKIVESFYSDYENAPNELKKSALRKKRKKKLASFLPSLRIKNWVGELDDMGTTGEGKAYITIKLEGSDAITIKTWNNSFSDLASNSLIKSGSKIYNQISDLSEGDLIKFSGSFIISKEDHIEEGSLTERGSMLDPEFIFRFKSISK